MAVQITVNDVNNDLSRAVCMADQYGSVVILKDNAPKYILIEFNNQNEEQEVSEKELIASSNKFLMRNNFVYQELAK